MDIYISDYIREYMTTYYEDIHDKPHDYFIYMTLNMTIL